VSRRRIVLTLIVALALLLGVTAPACAQTVVANIPVGNGPSGVAANVRTNRI
jgi:uncharacterized membrane protein YdfJ with MMPL/SSD domain